MKKPVQFGKYYLLERVNVGGMAEVFKAKTVGVEGFERSLAVKRILPNIAEDKEFITMFIDEAKIAVQLSHANICQIFDLGKVDEAYFIALEYVSGKDLRALFDRAKQRLDGGSGIMPIPQSCFCVMKMCEGLDYAHNKRDASGQDLGLVHRDVSPQNVLISFEGEVKIIDFGIAKAAGKASKTQAGILKGKFGYMSPEQVRGLPLDRRSDIFAVGIVLYEILTGERLFYGDSDFSILEKVRNVEILPPTAYNRKIPEELERIVLKALAKDVEDRYQNAIDLHDDLQAFMYTSGEFYSRKELAVYMKRTFAADIAAESARDEEYRSIASLMSPGGSDSRKAPEPPPPRKPTLAPKAPPPTPIVAAASMAKATAASRPAPTLETVESANDLSWDDDELETHVYEAAQDAADAVLEEEDLDDEPLPSLEDIDLATSGEPVPARSPRPEVQKIGMAATELGPSPVVRNGRATTPLAAVAVPAGPGPAPATPAKTVSLSAPVVRAPTPSPVVHPPAPAPAPVPVGARAVEPARAPRQGAATPARVSAAPASGTVKVAVPLAAPAPPVMVPARRDATPAPPNGAAFHGDSIGLMTAAVVRAPATRSAVPLLIGIGLAVVVVGGLAAYIALRPTTGEIALNVEPADGSRITVDGEKVSAQQAAHLVRAPGAHAVAVEHDGYKPWSREVSVRAGEAIAQLVSLELLPPGGFTIEPQPPTASVFVDGKMVGTGRLKVENLAPGRHVVDLQAAGFAPLSRAVDVESGRNVDVQAAMAPTTPAVPTAVAAVAPVVAAPAPVAPPEAPHLEAAAVVLPRLPPAHLAAPVAAPVAHAPVAPAVAPPVAHAAPPVAHAAPAVAHAAPPVENATSAPGEAAHADRGATPSGHRRLPAPPSAHAEAEAPPPPHVDAPVPRSSGGEGFMRIGSKPWTKISVDGRDTGLVTPQTQLKLSAGVHRVTLSNPQFGISESFSVDIKAGQTETVVKDLRPKDE